MRTISRPVVSLEETNRYGSPHHLHEVGGGGVQSGLLVRLAQAGARRGQGSRPGTMDPLQRTADTGDLHEWEMPCDKADTQMTQVCAHQNRRRYAQPAAPTGGYSRTRRGPAPVAECDPISRWRAE